MVPVIIDDHVIIAAILDLEPPLRPRKDSKASAILNTLTPSTVASAITPVAFEMLCLPGMLSAKSPSHFSRRNTLNANETPREHCLEAKLRGIVSP